MTKCAFDITENTTENNTDNFKTKVFSISELDELEQLKIDNKNLELKIKELEKATESDNVNIEVKKELPVKDSSAKKTDAPKKRKRKAQPKYPSSKALDIFNKYWMPLTGDEDGFYLNQKEARQLKNLFVFVNRKQKDATDEVKLESFDKFLALTLALENKFFTDSFTPSLLMCHSSTINTNIGSALTNKDNRQHHKIKSIWEGKSYEPVTTEYTKYLDECKEFFPSASQFKNVLSEEDFKLVKDRKVFEERVYGMYTRWDRMMLYIHWALDAGKINLSGHNGSMIEYMRRTIREYLNHKINDPSASNDEFDKFRINYITDNRVWYKK